MPKINLLDKHVAELIAAGEVVERPASVIKELVENAIDAGATVVTVEIKNGGVTYMRVTDNGCGMAAGDVKTAFLRHATSKVREQSDLDCIQTLGFRGEALASVAAVARVKLFTCEPDAECGTEYVIEGGEGGELIESGCPVGTTIIVKNLFYNVPARQKFLKKDASEASAVAGVLDRLALSHPEVSVRLIRDGRQTLSTPGDGRLDAAVLSVCGRDFYAGLLPVDYSADQITVTGYVTAPKAARPTRSGQHFFLNGRFMKSGTFTAALDEAYRHSIMVGKFAGCVLHIEVPLESADINVHPAKTQVRFDNERPIFSAIYYAIKSALGQGDSVGGLSLPQPAAATQSAATEPPVDPAPSEKAPILPPAPPVSALVLPGQPEIGAMKEAEGQTAPEPVEPAGQRVNLDVTVEGDFRAQNLREPAGGTYYQCARLFDGPDEPSVMPEAETAEPSPEAGNATVSEPALPETGLSLGTDLHLIGEAFSTYVFVQSGDAVWVVDKHAAHERVLYDQLQDSAAVAQMLLSPVVVTLDKEEYAALVQHLSEMEAAGFEVEDFGLGAVIVRAVPAALVGSDIKALISEAAGNLLRTGTAGLEALDWLYHSMACRAAMKAGDHSAPEELLELLERVAPFDDNGVRYCPHGRPVAFQLSKKELDKQFGRV